MPPECGEKITLQITNLLSVTVFLGMVSEITPPTSESIPIIAVFFSLSMLLLGCSIIATLVIINVHFRSPRTHQMGKWIQLIFLEWLPWFLLMSRPGKKFRRRELPKCSSNSGDEVSGS
ncbi:Neurotransmitter-gated ion-channel transmembrane region [Cooperia oncophora]